MAATAHTSNPQTEPFPALDTTASTAAVAPTATAGSDASSLLRPPVSPRVDAVPLLGTSPKSDKLGFSPRSSPIALTGAAATAELRRRNKPPQALQQTAAHKNSRQTTPNPAIEAVQSLLGAGGMSRPSDAPAPDKLSEPLRKAAEQMHVSDGAVLPEAEQQASPVSMASFGTTESAGATNTTTATAPDTSAPAPQFVAEPAQMTDSVNYPVNNGHLAPEDGDGNKAFSYPGLPQTDQTPDGGPSRGMSLPGYGQTSPKSPASNKRHKCPYCATDFTRHHNLKSHLLTHSQEKPFLCQTCQMRFRRLHDLKRHTKLHTGERPHTCDKCGRRFARGDALARHNKGPGGCAGRRSSFGGDDEYGPDGGDPNAMDGVEYAGADDDDDTSDPHGRRISEPNRKRQQLETPQDSSRQVYRQHSSTYPPAPSRSVRGSIGGGMGPPAVVHPGPSAANSPHDMSGHPSPTPAYYGPGQVFAEPGPITQSPKPLSPGGRSTDQHRLSAPDAPMAMSGRDRSTSLTTAFQQQAHVGRGSVGRTPPPGNPAQFPPSQPGLLPLPLGANSQPQNGRMHSTSISGGSAPNAASHHAQTQHGAAPAGTAGSNPGSLSSHGRSSGSSMRDVVGQESADVWSYIRQMEQKFTRKTDEYELRINRLHEEVISLRGQISNTASYSSEMARY